MKKKFLLAGTALLGLLLMALPSLVSAQAITVTSPAGNAQWCKGKSYDIKWWNQTGGQNNKVEIRLLDQAMITVLTITHNAPNTGHYPKWEIPKNLPTGSYRIGIRDKNSMATGHSALFKIRDCIIGPGALEQIPAQGRMKAVKPASPELAQQLALKIPVQSPMQGSQHASGIPLPIRWHRDVISGYSTVNIDLLHEPDGVVTKTIKTGALNTGEYNAWEPPLSWPGIFYVVRISTPDGKVSGYSGRFSIFNPPPKEKKPFTVEAKISNSWAYKRGGDLRPEDCLFAPNIQPGRQPGSGEVKIGHFCDDNQHGKCDYWEENYLRSRIFFDMTPYQGKEIVEASLFITLSDFIEFVPDGTLATNEELSSRCDIYLLKGPWPASPQQLYNFYPGTLVRNFFLSGKGKTAQVDLLDVVKDWAAGKPNHGLMLRGPVNRSGYVHSACVRYYHTVRLVGSYLE